MTINNTNYLQEHGTVAVQDFNIEGPDKNLESLIIKEILMTESLLTQSPQLAVKLHNVIYAPPGKDFDQWKNKDISFTLSRGSQSLRVKQKVFRMSDRKFMPTNVGQTEEFVVHACDETLLKDAAKLVSKSWKCTKPSDIERIVNYSSP